MRWCNLDLPNFIHSPEPPALLFHDAPRIYFSNSFFLAGGHSERWQAGLPPVMSALSLCGPRSFVFNANSFSENSTPYCLACGSQALLSLSRILGGSLRNHQTAHLIADAELDRLVRELLRTIPPPQPMVAKKGVSRDVAGYVSPTPFPCGDSARRFSSDVASLAPGRHHLRIKHVGFRGETDIRIFSDAGELDLEPEISIIAERAQALTGATGAAIALRKGDEIVCRARTGRTAPALGVRLDINSGLSAECVRTGEVLICEDA